MRSPIVASVALVAVIAVPVAAVAATKHHHKAHHVATHHSIRAAYGMYDPPRAYDPPQAAVLTPVGMCDGAYLNTITVEACDNLAVNGL